MNNNITDKLYWDNYWNNYKFDRVPEKVVFKKFMTSLSEAKSFIDNYLETYPGIVKFMEDTKAGAYRDGYVKTLMGRKRVIEELQNKNFMIRSSGERMALNTPIQGTSADIIKIAMVKLFDEFNKNNLESKILVQVHDELVIDCKKDELNIVKEVLNDKMKNVYKLSVNLDIDINYGNDWYEAK